MLVDAFEEVGLGREPSSEGCDGYLLLRYCVCTGDGVVSSFALLQGRWTTYFNDFQPWTKPSLLNSPIVGEDRASAIAKVATSSRLSCRSAIYLIEPSTPIVSGLWTGESVGYISAMGVSL